MTTPRVPTPECDKLLKVKDRSQEIGDFLEWLAGQEVELCTYVDKDGYHPVRESTEQLLAEYFGIDLAKIEQEKRAIMKTLGGQQDA